MTKKCWQMEWIQIWALACFLSILWGLLLSLEKLAKLALINFIFAIFFEDEDGFVQDCFDSFVIDEVEDQLLTLKWRYKSHHQYLDIQGGRTEHAVAHNWFSLARPCTSPKQCCLWLTNQIVESLGTLDPPNWSTRNLVFLYFINHCTQSVFIEDFYSQKVRWVRIVVQYLDCSFAHRKILVLFINSTRRCAVLFCTTTTAGFCNVGTFPD